MGFQPKTVKDLLDWSYANLAAYQVALAQDPPVYNKICWMTRSRIYRGLQSGDMRRQSIYKNEQEKLTHKDRCAYCGANDVPLTLDHLFAKSRHGTDSGDNLVYCCRKCNSSKGSRDYFQWIQATGKPVSVPVAERYLKNAYTYCLQAGILDLPLDAVPSDLPFDLRSIPLTWDIPKPAMG